MISRSDIKNSIIFGEAVIILSIPVLKNIGIWNNIVHSGIWNIIFTIVANVILVPALLIFGLYIAHNLPFASEDLKYQLGRYGIVGLFNTFLNAALFNILIYLTNISSGSGIVLFSVISFVIVVAQAFFWNKYWTFKGSTPYSHAQYIKFFVVSTVVAAINALFMHFLVNEIGSPGSLDPKIWANISLAFTIIVSVLGNFAGYKLFVFNHKKPEQPELSEAN